MGDNETVRIKLLGTFTISRGKLSVSEPLVSKESQSWKLLKYLCANCGRMIDADELTRELIFAGSESNIGNTLRVRLRRARAILDHIGLGGAMDGPILYGGGKYCINPELDIKIDVREADRLCRRAADKTLDIKRRLALCIEALRLYDGPCLANSERSMYIDLMRAQYGAMYKALLRQTFSLMRETGNYSGADILCRSALQVCPRDTDVHELIITALLSANHTAEAVAYYTSVAVALANTKDRLPEFGTYIDRCGTYTKQEDQNDGFGEEQRC